MRVVILHGPESFLIEAHSQALQSALETAYEGLDITRHDGASASIADVLDDLHTLCFLSPHKLVIVDEADRLLAAKDDDDSTASRSRTSKAPRALLERYADDPIEASTLLLRAATWRPGRLDKKASVFKCEIPDDRAAAAWCTERAKAQWKCPIDPAAAALLVERLGPGLVRLDSELGKLAAFCHQAGRIDRNAVGEMVGIGREEKVWALQDPILACNAAGTIRQLHELLNVSGQPDVLITWAITDLLRKLASASHMLRAGMPAGSVRSELKLFGPAAARILDIGARIPPAPLIALLHDALEADRGAKSGLGRAERNLEILALRIVDTIGR